MNCFARWRQGQQSGVFFRDQTILQIGEDWRLLASFVLLNPGSATPANLSSQNREIRARHLPYFVVPRPTEHYYRFKIDRLMRDLLKIFVAEYDGGVIKIYNLFNLKNQHSGEALRQLQRHKTDSRMFTPPEEIRYGKAPVVIATGGKALQHPVLTAELRKYVACADANLLFALSRTGDHTFAFRKVRPNHDGRVQSFHPSYTFKYGNTTTFEGFGRT